MTTATYSQETYRALSRKKKATRQTNDYQKWVRIFSVCNLLDAYQDTNHLLLSKNAEDVTAEHKAIFLAYNDTWQRQYNHQKRLDEQVEHEEWAERRMG